MFQFNIWPSALQQRMGGCPVQEWEHFQCSTRGTDWALFLRSCSWISPVPGPAAPQSRHRQGISSGIPQTRAVLLSMPSFISVVPWCEDAPSQGWCHRCHFPDWSPGTSLLAQHFGWLPPARPHPVVRSSWKSPSWCFPWWQQLTGGALHFRFQGFLDFPFSSLPVHSHPFLPSHTNLNIPSFCKKTGIMRSSCIHGMKQPSSLIYREGFHNSSSGNRFRMQEIVVRAAAPCEGKKRWQWGGKNTPHTWHWLPIPGGV